jgi:hypothetical protein
MGKENNQYSDRRKINENEVISEPRLCGSLPTSFIKSI